MVKVLFVGVGDSQQVVRFHARWVECDLFGKYLPRLLEMALLDQRSSFLQGGYRRRRLRIVSRERELWRCKCPGGNRKHDERKAAEQPRAPIGFQPLNRSAITRLHMPSEGLNIAFAAFAEPP